MAIKWSAFSAGSAISGSNEFVGLASSVNVRWTADQVKTWTSASPTLVTPVLGVASGTSLTISAQIWSGTISSALSSLTGASDGFRSGAANVTLAAGENTTASSSTQGGFFGAYSNDGAAMGSGDRLGGIRIGGSSSASAIRSTALIGAFADEAWVDASAYGTRLEFQTVTNGATALSVKMTIANNGVVNVCANTATPANGSVAARLVFGTTAGFGIYYGSGAPTGLTAAKGSWYMRSDGGGVADRAYINTDGSTAWTAIATAG